MSRAHIAIKSRLWILTVDKFRATPDMGRETEPLSPSTKVRDA